MSNRVATLAIPAKSILMAGAVFAVLALLALPVGCTPPSSGPSTAPSPSPTLGGGASTLTVTGSTDLPIIPTSDIGGGATSTPTPGAGIFTPNVVPGAPSQVTGLQGSTQLDVGVTHLAWNPSPPDDAVLGYRVYRSSVGEVSFQLLADVPADVTAYTDETAGCGQMYFVTAHNAKGESLPSTSSYFSQSCR